MQKYTNSPLNVSLNSPIANLYNAKFGDLQNQTSFIDVPSSRRITTTATPASPALRYEECYGVNITKIVLILYIGTPLEIIGIGSSILAFVIFLFDKVTPKTTKLLLQSMAIIDTLLFMSALGSLNLKAAYLAFGANTEIGQKLKSVQSYSMPTAFVMLNFFEMARNWLTVLIGVERYLVTCRPLYANHICTKSLTVIAIFSTLLLSLLLRIPVALLEVAKSRNWNAQLVNATRQAHTTVDCVFLALLPALLLIVCSWQIIRVLKISRILLAKSTAEHRHESIINQWYYLYDMAPNANPIYYEGLKAYMTSKNKQFRNSGLEGETAPARLPRQRKHYLCCCGYEAYANRKTSSKVSDISDSNSSQYRPNYKPNSCWLFYCINRQNHFTDSVNVLKKHNGVGETYAKFSRICPSKNEYMATQNDFCKQNAHSSLSKSSMQIQKCSKLSDFMRTSTINRVVGGKNNSVTSYSINSNSAKVFHKHFYSNNHSCSSNVCRCFNRFVCQHRTSRNYIHNCSKGDVDNFAPVNDASLGSSFMDQKAPMPVLAYTASARVSAKDMAMGRQAPTPAMAKKRNQFALQLFSSLERRSVTASGLDMKRRRLKVTRMLIVIIFLFLILAVPSIVYQILIAIGNTDCAKRLMSPVHWLVSLAYSTTNFFVYIAYMPKYREILTWMFLPSQCTAEARPPYNRHIVKQLKSKKYYNCCGLACACMPTYSFLRLPVAFRRFLARCAAFCGFCYCCCCKLPRQNNAFVDNRPTIPRHLYIYRESKLGRPSSKASIEQKQSKNQLIEAIMSQGGARQLNNLGSTGYKSTQNSRSRKDMFRFGLKTNCINSFTKDKLNPTNLHYNVVHSLPLSNMNSTGFMGRQADTRQLSHSAYQLKQHCSYGVQLNQFTLTPHQFNSEKEQSTSSNFPLSNTILGAQESDSRQSCFDFPPTNGCRQHPVGLLPMSLLTNRSDPCVCNAMRLAKITANTGEIANSNIPVNFANQTKCNSGSCCKQSNRGFWNMQTKDCMDNYSTNHMDQHSPDPPSNVTSECTSSEAPSFNHTCAALSSRLLPLTCHVHQCARPSIQTFTSAANQYANHHLMPYYYYLHHQPFHQHPHQNFQHSTQFSDYNPALCHPRSHLHTRQHQFFGLVPPSHYCHHNHFTNYCPHNLHSHQFHKHCHNSGNNNNNNSNNEINENNNDKTSVSNTFKNNKNSSSEYNVNNENCTINEQNNSFTNINDVNTTSYSPIGMISNDCIDSQGMTKFPKFTLNEPGCSSIRISISGSNADIHVQDDSKSQPTMPNFTSEMLDQTDSENLTQDYVHRTVDASDLSQNVLLHRSTNDQEVLLDITSDQIPSENLTEDYVDRTDDASDLTQNVLLQRSTNSQEVLLDITLQNNTSNDGLENINSVTDACKSANDSTKSANVQNLKM